MLDLVRDGRLDMRAKAGQRVVEPRALDVFGVGADALVKLRGGGERALCQPQGAAILEVDVEGLELLAQLLHRIDRKSTRLNSSHSQISYAVFCLKKKNTNVLINVTSRVSLHHSPLRSRTRSTLKVTLSNPNTHYINHSMPLYNPSQPVSCTVSLC